MPETTSMQKPREGRYKIRSARTKPTRNKIFEAGKNGKIMTAKETLTVLQRRKKKLQPLRHCPSNNGHYLVLKTVEKKKYQNNHLIFCMLGVFLFRKRSVHPRTSRLPILVPLQTFTTLRIYTFKVINKNDK